MVQYGLLTGLIAVGAILAIDGLGGQVSSTFAAVSERIEDKLDEINYNNGCYNPKNVGQVGTAGMWGECTGMLIVDNAMLRGAAAPAAGGDGSFDLSANGQTYSFAEGGGDVFTGQVTDMSRLFDGTSFNGAIGYWETDRVTDMSAMFRDNASFNQPIAGWETENVTDMAAMFQGAGAFNQPIGNWETARVRDMSEMFSGAGSFDQPIGRWNTARVVDMGYMFSGASDFSADLSSWNVANVVEFEGMFFNASSFSADLSGWDTTSATAMGGMFSNASAFNADLSGWCVDFATNKPFGFDQGASAWTDPRPVWGTCP